MFDTLLKFLLFGSQLFYIRGQAMTNCDIKFFHLSVLSMAMASLYNEKKRYMFHVKLLAVLFWICIFNIFTHNFDGIVCNSIVNMFIFIYGMILIYQNCDNPKECAKWLCYGVVTNVIIMLFQRADYNPFIEYPKFYPGGLMGNAPRLIMSVCIAIPLLWQWSKPVFWTILIACVPWGQEIGIYIWSAIFLLIVIKNKLVRFMIVSGFISGVICCFHHAYCAVYERLKIFAEAFIEYFNTPFQGVGAGVLPVFKGQIDASRDSQMASSFLKFICSFGIPGTVWLSIIVKGFFSSFDRSFPSLSVLGFLILSLFEYPFEITRLWVMLMFVFAYFLIERKEYEESIG